MLPIVGATHCSTTPPDCEATATCPGDRLTTEAGTATDAAAAPTTAQTGEPLSHRDAAIEALDVGPRIPIDAQNVRPDAAPQPEAGAGLPSAPQCDPGSAPLASACVSNGFGVFVSPDGDDTADGSREAPFRTIGRAIEAGVSQQKMVFVCSGRDPYTAPLSLGPQHGGVRVYGGFECSSWTLTGGQTVVQTSPPAIPLQIRGIEKPILLQDFRFVAANAREPGQSSIAAFVSESKGVQLVRVALVAGTGAHGANGDEPKSNYVVVPHGDDWRIAGRAAQGFNGGTGQSCEYLCTGAHSSVGTGGLGDQLFPTGGTSGGPSYPMSQTADADGRGGVPDLSCENGGGSGAAGADAPPAAGGLGAVGHGRLTRDGWLSASGHDGKTGVPGQGGGGGAGGRNRSIDEPQGGGGGGGCGGCGGSGGNGGKGGGASFALLSFQSAVILDSCELRVSMAGNGGNGSSGQLGQPGGSAGFGSPPGCPGGRGGTGGAGGPGGGGAGGLSVAVGYLGTAPTVLNVSFALPPGVSHGGAAGAATAFQSDAGAGDDAGQPAILAPEAGLETDAAIHADGSAADGAGDNHGAADNLQRASRGVDGIQAETLELSAL